METISAKDLEESFSFSCHELNSAVQQFIYSPSSSSSSDDESYIEIDLDSAPHSKEFECRISLSSLEFPHQIRTTDLAHACKISNPTSHREAGVSRVGVGSSSQGGHGNSTVDISSCAVASLQQQQQQQQPEVKAAGRGVSDCSRKNRQFIRRVRNEDDLFGNRKPSKIATVVNNGIMKFFIKLRSGNIMSTFMSLIKSYHTCSLQSNEEGNYTGSRPQLCQRLTKPFTTRWAQLNDINIIINTNSRRGTTTTTNNNNNSKRSLQRENSLHAAIAYCKRSSPLDIVDCC